MSVRTRTIVAACLSAVALGAAFGHDRMPNDLVSPEVRACQYEDSPGPCHWDASKQGNGEGTSFDAPPYCMVDREVPLFLTVAGPSGGIITVNDRRVGELVLVEGDYEDEVAPDAGPFDGILYNVPGPGVVEVDDIECVTT